MEFEEVVSRLLRPADKVDVHDRLDHVIWLQTYLQWPDESDEFRRVFANVIYWSRIFVLSKGKNALSLDLGRIEKNVFRSVEASHFYLYSESEKFPRIDFRFLQKYDDLSLIADFA